MNSLHASSFQDKLPLITIITVVKNGREYIQETMDSVFSQEYKNIEYIVVDGCSNDGTSEIIYNNKDKIDLIIREEDAGIYPAMNKGIDSANGILIGFLNASDLLYSDSISRLADAFEVPPVTVSPVIKALFDEMNNLEFSFSSSALF